MDTLPFNLTDAAIALVIVASGAFAFLRGFVHELLAITSWIGAGLATYFVFPVARPLAREWIASPFLADMACGIVTFLVVLVVLSFASHLISRRIRNSSLGPLDRSLGLAFGILRGGVLVCIAWMILVWLLPREDHPEWITEARSLPLVERGGAILATLLPERMRKAIPEPSKAGADEQSFRRLLKPTTNSDAPEDQPGYKERERDAMQRLIEATTPDTAQVEGSAE